MKYLIRGGRLPMQKVAIERYLDDNMFGDNTGNYMYLNSIIRTLTTSTEIQFESTNYKYNYSEKEISRINEECDGFIIPLADAFRSNWVGEMVGMTKLINSLKIPCYIIGVGAAAGSDEKLANQSFGFEREACEFVKAVLNKSACVGVRGQFTGDFLKYLGFREDIDYQIIGCPSLYTFGHHIQIRDTDINPDCRAASNGTLTTDIQTIKKLDEYRKEFHNLIFVGQLRNELRTLYLGVDYRKEAEYQDYYPCNIHHPLYANDKVRVFYNTDRWIDFYRDIDFSFGTRFHGNVPATIAGAPSLLITKDIRMQELAEYHHLTYVRKEDLKQYRDIWEIIEKADFHRPEAVAKENFSRYLDFLHKNGLQTIYDDDFDRIDAPLDDIIAKSDVLPDVTSCVSCSSEEWNERLMTQYDYVVGARKNLQKEVHSLRADVAKQKKKASQADKAQKDLKKANEQIADSDKKIKNLEEKLKAANEQLEIERNKPLYKKVKESVRKWVKK